MRPDSSGKQTARAWPLRRPLRRIPLQQIGNHGVSDDPPKTLSSRFQTLSQAAAGGTAPGNASTWQGRLPAPATPAAAERPLFLTPIRRNQQSRIVLLAA